MTSVIESVTPDSSNISPLKRLVVLEGPAGGGKTTAIGYLCERYGWPIAEPGFFPRPRDVTGFRADALTIDREMAKFALAITDDNDTVLMDRWLLSGYIYNLIRRQEQPRFDTLDFTRQTKQLIQMAECMSMILHGRAFDVRPWTIHYIMLLPPLEALSQRRKNSDRLYPYPVDLEHLYYLRAVEAFMDEGFNWAFRDHLGGVNVIYDTDKIGVKDKLDRILGPIPD